MEGQPNIVRPRPSVLADNHADRIKAKILEIRGNEMVRALITDLTPEQKEIILLSGIIDLGIQESRLCIRDVKIKGILLLDADNDTRAMLSRYVDTQANPPPHAEECKLTTYEKYWVDSLKRLISLFKDQTMAQRLILTHNSSNACVTLLTILLLVE